MSFFFTARKVLRGVAPFLRASVSTSATTAGVMCSPIDANEESCVGGKNKRGVDRRKERSRAG